MVYVDFFMTTLISAAPVLGLLLSVFVFIRYRKESRGAVSMSLYLFIFSLILFWNEFSSRVLGSDYPLFFRLMGPFLALIGPGLYFSLRNILEHDFKHRLADFLHFIPFLFYFLHLTAFYIHNVGVLSHNYGNIYLLLGLWLGLFIHYLCYALLSLRNLRRYSVRLKQLFSNTDPYSLSWLIPVMAGFFILLLFQGLLLMGLFHKHIDTVQLNRILSFCFAVFIYFSAWKALFGRQKLPQVPVSERGGKDKKPSIGKGERETILSRVMDLMHVEKPYLDPDLTLAQLAEICDLTTHRLSEVLNGSGTFFYDFINRYRVEEFCRLLSLPESRQYTLLALAYDAGFNSKTTFNTVFKKMKGITPSQYKKTLPN